MSTMINNPQEHEPKKKIGDASKLLRKSGKLAIVVRYMQLSDLMEVSRIEKDVYGFVKHWRYDDLFWGLNEPGIHCLVATPRWDKNEILGYVIYRSKWASRENPHFDTEIQNITVIPKMQRNGIGLNLLAEVAYGCTMIKSITAEVSEYSTKTQLFFKSCGFECVQVVKGAYSYETRDGETKVFDAYRFGIGV